MIDFSTPVSGIQQAIQLQNLSARKLASQNLNEIDLAQEMVNQLQAKQMVAMNTSVIKTNNEMIGTLIDIVG